MNKIFCTKITWKSCNDIDLVRKHVIALMDTRRVFKRLHKTEKIINSKIDTR